MWSDVTANSSKIKPGNNSARIIAFDTTNKYLALIIKPAGSDITGSTIVFDTNALLSNYGTGLNLILCDEYVSNTKTFNYYLGGPVQQVKIGDSVPANDMYFTLDNYSLTSIPDAAVTIFPYTIGAMNSGAVFAYQGKGDSLQMINLPRNVTVSIRHSPWGIWTYVIIFLLIIFVIIVAVVGYKMYKKHKTG
jgi:hypothetical protein